MHLVLITHVKDFTCRLGHSRYLIDVSCNFCCSCYYCSCLSSLFFFCYILFLEVRRKQFFIIPCTKQDTSKWYYLILYPFLSALSLEPTFLKPGVITDRRKVFSWPSLNIPWLVIPWKQTVQLFWLPDVPTTCMLVFILKYCLFLETVQCFLKMCLLLK